MENFKIRVKSPEHSKLIQEKLFEMGYNWPRSRKSVQYTNNPFLYVSLNDLLIRTHTAISDYTHMKEYFQENLKYSTEVELIEKITYEFREIPKKNVVKIGDNSYYEEELAEALKNIKPI